ncbi:MAG: CAAX prenyl protease-related protein [Acidobacteria bacterium]|nr:CAAX prenyl protease-related protein [Acidobacteriota bacterium]
MERLWRHPAFPYVAPFALFLLLLSLQDYLLFLEAWQAPLRFAALGAVLLLVSRRVVDLRMASPAATVALGLVVFALWIAPDLLWPGYRQHWLFDNRLLGSAANPHNRILSESGMFIVFRLLRAVVIVPVVEELFWRGWLMRWLVHPDFQSVPLGAYTRRSFWWTAILFAMEHGSYWEVGLIAGVAYNWWMIRTRRLGDCILAHAVTNAALSAYVVLYGQWQYWP